MHEPDSTRRTALKGLALLGAGTTGIGVAAAEDHRNGDGNHGDDPGDGQRSSPSGLFVATLEPREGVETDARGTALVQERQDGLKFVLQVSNLENAFMGHVHEDETLGPIAVWLYDFLTQDERLEEGRFSGILDAGTITDEAVAEGRVPEAESETVDDLLGKLEAGEAYVNVHTEAYPSGEIAGALVPFDPSDMMRRGGFDDGSESDDP
ncbi:CHRD domain-containing protein [Natrinema pellirubrum DSM 15624]|uniref:CHRD domain-containing protein n=1 Tax=Natrinema pellirubrum (strain DSM 15624 / CIP 106293 / JCM 10476 / NCIMB 786 / 157) TaxID=797303 RepID=L0JLC4_NATP1|nr:CHRD domain-containing protein [Natrinema pellirubrum]AGB32305.1 CHRD domain-containing protein [Natrinema pellirubrum DSM 15624]ELY74257.1 CHRD domain-containing protein [Natrinema pellirubrum DSM 15624]